MDMNQVHWLPILVATVAAFLIGGLWYSPVLFGKSWMNVNGLTDAHMAARSQSKTFLLAFVFTLLMAINLAAFLANPKTTAAFGAAAGLAAGFGWVTLGIAVISQFEQRSWKYVAINGGYMTVTFVVMGAIIGGWR
jgi:hypothetical protein